MKFQDSKTINAPRGRTYALFCKPRVLQRCIPKCNGLTQISENHFEARIGVRIAWLNEEVPCVIELDTSGKPDKLGIAIRGRGRLADLAKGDIIIIFTRSSEDKTQLSYVVQSHLDGAIMRFGSRLIERELKTLTINFFNNFSDVVDQREAQRAAKV
ncbi:CoxG family protein [Pseudodonghicola sp.]|uniref:CoxG family protein n=1 Tax=Pseudodonghicola sp. TaxID=1969463 RepID=UPI003A96B4DD